MICPRCVEKDALLAKYRELVAKKDNFVRTMRHHMDKKRHPDFCFWMDSYLALEIEGELGGVKYDEKTYAFNKIEAIALPLPEAVIVRDGVLPSHVTLPSAKPEITLPITNPCSHRIHSATEPAEANEYSGYDLVYKEAKALHVASKPDAEQVSQSCLSCKFEYECKDDDDCIGYQQFVPKERE